MSSEPTHDEQLSKDCKHVIDGLVNSKHTTKLYNEEKINEELLQNDKGITIEKSKVLWRGKAVSAFKIFRDSVIHISCVV